MARVVLVARVRETRRLIRLRVEDQAKDVPQVVLAGQQLLGQVVEQLGIFRRVGRPQVVGLVNDSPPQQPVPHPIDGVAGEPGVLGRREPLAQSGRAGRPGGQIHHVAAQQLRLHAFLLSRIPQSALGIEEDDFLFPFVGRLETDFAEEGGHAHVVVQSPLFRGMAMAAASQPGPHENQRRHVGKALRVLIAHGPIVIARSVSEIAAAGDQQLPDKLIVGLVLGDGVADPAGNRSSPPAASTLTGYSLLIRSRSPHLRAQKSANSSRSSRRSISLLRFCGSPSARNARTSSGVGSTPVVSR